MISRELILRIQIYTTAPNWNLTNQLTYDCITLYCFLVPGNPLISTETHTTQIIIIIFLRCIFHYTYNCYLTWDRVGRRSVICRARVQFWLKQNRILQTTFSNVFAWIQFTITIQFWQHVQSVIRRISVNRTIVGRWKKAERLSRGLIISYVINISRT